MPGRNLDTCIAIRMVVLKTATPTCRFEHVDPDDLQRTGDLALALLRSLTIADRTGLQPVS